MEPIGVIRGNSSGPTLDFDAWCALVRRRPELVQPPARTVPNPFKKGELMTVRPSADAADVVVDGRKVGLMHWSMDGRPEIIVSGELAIVRPVAEELAALLGGQFATDMGQEE
jgi:hypothetical protein